VKPLYKTLLVIGTAMGVVATSLIFGVGQTLLMHVQARRTTDQYTYSIYQSSSDGWITGMSLSLAREVQSWLPDGTTASVISFEQHGAVVQIGPEFYGASVIGVDASFASLSGLGVLEGRFFSNEDQKARQRVCAVTSDLVALFGWEALRSLRINGKEYEVVGSVQGDVNVSSLILGSYSSNTIFLPVEVWYEDLHEGVFQHGLIMQLVVDAPGLSSAELSMRLSQNLLHMEDAPVLKIADPHERDSREWVETLLALTGIFLVAFVVFLLAGLNIIQIASADVWDQQRVFGLKVALGALPKHLAREITGQIAACALQGGYLGVVLAGVVNTVMNRVVGRYWASFNIFTVLAGIILALLTGWVTAVVPVRQAARIDPVVVLRQER
jgi:putative ABC transport system permease protein